MPREVVLNVFITVTNSFPFEEGRLAVLGLTPFLNAPHYATPPKGRRRADLKVLSVLDMCEQGIR